MPLDSRKAQHILSLVAKTFTGRQQTVVITYLVSGSYSYSALQAILRPQQVLDPQIFDAGGQPPKRSANMLLIAPLGTNFSGAIYVADTATATASAVASAPKYEIVEVLPTGIVPGGTHLRVLLRRLR